MKTTCVFRLRMDVTPAGPLSACIDYSNGNVGGAQELPARPDLFVLYEKAVLETMARNPDMSRAMASDVVLGNWYENEDARPPSATPRPIGWEWRASTTHVLNVPGLPSTPKDDFAALADAHTWLFTRRREFWNVVRDRCQFRWNSESMVAWPDVLWQLQPGDFVAARDEVLKP